MIRIGLIGSQSMHAGAFASACNVPNEDGAFLIPDCRVTAICGADDTAEHTAEVAEQGRIEQIVTDTEKLFDLCDAVMVVTRDGNTHVPYALPFLRRDTRYFSTSRYVSRLKILRFWKKLCMNGNVS